MKRAIGVTLDVLQALLSIWTYATERQHGKETLQIVPPERRLPLRPPHAYIERLRPRPSYRVADSDKRRRPLKLTLA